MNENDCHQNGRRYFEDILSSFFILRLAIFIPIKFTNNQLTGEKR